MRGYEDIGAGIGMIQRVQQITDNPSTEYPSKLATSMINPVIDLGVPQIERIMLMAVGPTSNGSQPNFLFNDDDLLQKINSANAFIINNWSVVATGVSGTWGIETQLEVTMQSPTDTVVRICGWQYENIGSGDAVRLGQYGLGCYFDLKRGDHWNFGSNSFQDFVLTNLNFRGQNHVSGTGNYSNLVIDLSLLY